MKRFPFLVLPIILLNLSFSRGISESQIKGTIINATEKSIQIGGITIPLSEKGEFVFTAKAESPMLYEVIYGEMNWLVYIEPNRTAEFTLHSGDLSSLEYDGQLIEQNNCLKEASLLEQSVNEFNSMFKLFSKNEADFLQAIDSLIILYQNPISYVTKGKTKVSKDFVSLFEANASLRIYSFIIHYPDFHWQVTREGVDLSKAGLDYINPKTVDNIRLLDLSSYQEFTRLWIDYNADILAEKNTKQKDYNHKKMEILFAYLPNLFSNQELIDYWLSEYLSEFMQNNGVANSEKYIKDFYSLSKTEAYQKRIEELHNSILEGHKDHIVKTYKYINGYVLQAHIFYPDNKKEGEMRPAIAIFHGGGWNSGNYSWAFGPAKFYSNLGMIGIAVQYRLSNQKDITPIDAMQDAKDLMIWLRQNSESLGILRNKIAASGWSAGAHLIASAAVFADTLPGNKINSVPDVLLLKSPAVDVGHNQLWFSQLISNTDVDPFSLSPVEHVRKGLPPTIILQGREDHVTPLDDVQLFHDRMVANDNYCEIWIYDNVGHLFTPSYLDDTGYPQPDHEIEKQADKKAVEFLKKFGFISK